MIRSETGWQTLFPKRFVFCFVLATGHSKKLVDHRFRSLIHVSQLRADALFVVYRLNHLGIVHVRRSRVRNTWDFCRFWIVYYCEQTSRPIIAIRSKIITEVFAP